MQRIVYPLFFVCDCIGMTICLLYNYVGELTVFSSLVWVEGEELWCAFVFISNLCIYVDVYISMVVCTLYVCSCDSCESRLCTYFELCFF